MKNTYKAVFICLLLLVSTFAQTDFGNTCQTDSLMNRLATGQINMNLIDSFNGGANKDTYRDLTLAKFEKQEVLGHAFALTGFQGPCGQPFYTLVIDKVQFENDNTRMRIVVNYRTTNNGLTPMLTKWTRVSFTYIVVSRGFSGTYSDIWATVAQVQGIQLAAANAAPVAVDTIAIPFSKLAGGVAGTPTQCSAYRDTGVGTTNIGFNYQHGALVCSAAQIDVVPNNLRGGRIVIHAYVMGFGFDPSRSTDRFLAASVFNQEYHPVTTGGNAVQFFPHRAQLINQGGALGSGGGVFRVEFKHQSPPIPPSPPDVAGPAVSIYNFNGALNYIKIGFVYTRYNERLDSNPNQNSPVDTSATRSLYRLTGYTGGQLQYTSSHVFTTVTTFNAAQNLRRRSTRDQWNRLYFTLPDTRYAIYGLTSFVLPKSTTAACTSNINIQSKLNSINSITVNTPNASPSHFVFSADIYTVNHFLLCAPANGGDRSTYKFEVGRKGYFTVPTLSNEQYILQVVPVSTITLPNLYTLSGISPHNPVVPGSELNADKAIYLTFFGPQSAANTDLIQYTAEIPFVGLTPNAPLKFQLGWFTLTDPLQWNSFPVGSPFRTLSSLKAGDNYTIKFSVNGMTIYQKIHVGLNFANANNNRQVRIFKGININQATATVKIQISFKRSGGTTVDTFAGVATHNIGIFTYVRLAQYLRAYNPLTGCCVSSCPTNNGLNVVIDPPTCVNCDTRAGLQFNPSVGTCTCRKGFYLDAISTFQCYPCRALYCDICPANNPDICTTCSTGAVLSLSGTQTCSCSTGYYPTGTTCTVCPIACQTCQAPSGKCLTCVNADLRDLTKNCACIDGYFHNNEVNCVKCSSTCATCQSASACLTCPANSFRTLRDKACVCIAGYYEVYNADQSRTCQPCSPECLTCQVSPSQCLTCDPAKNRVPGINQYGVQTCLCNPGFYSTEDGSCIQSNCNADPFCSQCQQGLQLCIQCLATKNRVIKLPESICVCMDGFYPDLNNNCVACSAGCLTCRSSTVCLSCVALATPSTSVSGQCNCPERTFFSVSTTGTRYCANCGQYCLSCSSGSTCRTCQNSFTLVSGVCQCPNRFFVNTAGNCVPCAGGCDICSSATNCTQCIAPLLLQGTGCQASCNNGFTPLGNQCVGCPAGCLQCTQNLICYYCADNQFIYKGSCFQVCPAGTIGDRSAGNWQCIPCNSPCKTCMNHPSYCTSCENGKGYLQTSAVQQSCVLQCTDGTFARNGVCQVCDFTCATCLGASSNCISCPNGQTLYNGGCWARCPAILISNTGSGSAELCVENCPDGFYKVSVSQCSPCAPQCTTCSNSATNCTSCLHGSVTLAGTCSAKCGQNEFSFSGVCIACSKSCYGCSITPQNCDECAEGYVKSGTICQIGCLRDQFYDQPRSACSNCPTGCATCSSSTNCTSCTNTAISPRGGVCASCPYPCATCDSTGVCNTCLSGFYFFQGACQNRCPQGSTQRNSICVCNSGIIANGRCVASCSSGFTAINGNCVACNQNCAQCSGSINTCTSCLSGFVVDVRTQTCVSATQCNYGQQFDNGNCQNICDSGYFYYESLCIFGGCFEGYQPNSFGGCVRSATTSSSGCQPSQYRQNGRCVQECSAGFYADFVNGVCSPCSSNCAACFNNNFCVTCASGFQNSNGACVQGTTCPVNQVQYGNRCVSSCPAGNFQSGSQCIRSCPPETYFGNQICWINCPTGLVRTADACLQSCPAGTTSQDGICR